MWAGLSSPARARGTHVVAIHAAHLGRRGSEVQCDAASALPWRALPLAGVDNPAYTHGIDRCG